MVKRNVLDEFLHCLEVGVALEAGGVMGGHSREQPH